MPKTKTYTDRIRLLNSMFRSRHYTLSQLTERVNNHLGTGVKERTIEKDIKDMRAENAPIQFHKGKGYIYDPIGYNHFEVKIESAAVEKIKLAAAILKQFPGLDLHEELNYIFEKLDMKAEAEDEDEIIQFDTRPGYEGSKYMVDILEAIKGKTVVSFDYQPFKYDTSRKVVVHPYLLKEFNNRWFLIGLTEDWRKQKRYEFAQFALERIKSKVKVEGTIEHFQPSSFDPAKLYQNVYGMSIPAGVAVQKVILQFSANRAKYVATNPLHHTQQKVKNTETTFEFQLVPNNELEALILSYGSDVEVLKPKDLRDRLAFLITETGKRYFTECR